MKPTHKTIYTMDIKMAQCVLFRQILISHLMTELCIFYCWLKTRL